MITRDIKVGDKIRWLNAGCEDKRTGGDVFKVTQVNMDDRVVFDSNGRSWASVFSHPGDFDIVDEPQVDPVNHPPHYTAGEIECIDAIRAALGREQYEGYLRGACFKYIWRYNLKGGVESLRKAKWYLERLIDCYEKAEP